MELITKIRQEIERLKAENESIKCASNGAYCTGYDDAFYDILPFLDTLQEPEKRGYKDCNGCEYNRTLKDQIGWQFRGCFGGDYKGKPIAEIELCPLKVDALQEPEVDLDANIEMEWDSFNKHIAKYGEETEDVIWLNRFSFEDVARNFYNLGLKNTK